jgi:hypothetical protein
MGSPMQHTVIHLHRGAPAKPALGQPCNGCGVCCASEPCPAGMLVSRRRRGACNALQWQDAGRLYRCGLIATPAAFLPRPLRWAAPALAAWARRAIGASRGCDSSVSVQRAPL